MDDDYENFSAPYDNDVLASNSSSALDTKGKKERKKREKKESAEEEVIVRIKEFDLNSIPPHKPSDSSGVKICVIGKAGTGKSTLINALIASKAHLAPVIQVYNGSEDANNGYSSKCPPALVYNKIDLNSLINFKNRQTLAGKHIPENPWAIQVIDDCTDDPKILKHPIIQAYYKNGRHWHMIHILSLQYCMDIMPSIRANMDYVFILRESVRRNRKKLYEDYCPDCVETLQDFNALMDALTEDFSALVICNRTSSNKLEDCIFYFKADPNAVSPAWKFGHHTTWDFNEERFDPTYTPNLTIGE